MTGDEWPGGSAVFQMTFLSGPISLGSARSSLGMPVALGPRNCDQSPAKVELHKMQNIASENQRIKGLIIKQKRELTTMTLAARTDENHLPPLNHWLGSASAVGQAAVLANAPQREVASWFVCSTSCSRTASADARTARGSSAAQM